MTIRGGGELLLLTEKVEQALLKFTNTPEERLSGILRGVKSLYYQLLTSTDRRSHILRSESSGAPDF